MKDSAVHRFCEEMNFPKEAQAAICAVYNKVRADETAYDELINEMDDFFLADYTNEKYKITLAKISERLAVNIYTLHMVFVIMAARAARYIFNAKGYPDEIYHATMQDMQYKLEECRKMYGVWGTFVVEWFRHVLRGRVVAIGRLQFEPTTSPVNYKDIIKIGDRIVNVHIPSSGPLKIGDVYDAFNRAYAFFGESGDMVLSCHSWLLYPPQYAFYPEGSNLRAFYDLWDITNVENSNGNFWRVFYKEEGCDLSEIEPQTRLAKGILEHLKKGGTMGFSRGFLLWRPNGQDRIEGLNQ